MVVVTFFTNRVIVTFFFLGLQECSVNQDFIGQGLKGIKS